MKLESKIEKLTRLIPHHAMSSLVLCGRQPVNTCEYTFVSEYSLHSVNMLTKAFTSPFHVLTIKNQCVS